MAFVDERFLGPLADPPAAPPAVSPSAGQSADRIARVREIMHQGVTQHQGFNKSGKYKLHRAVDAVIDGVQEWEQTRGLSFDEAISNPQIQDEMARFVLERADGVPKLDFDKDINTGWFEQQGFKREDLNALKQAAEQEKERILSGGSFTEGRGAINAPIDDDKSVERQDALIAYAETRLEDAAMMKDKLRSQNPYIDDEDLKAQVDAFMKNDEETRRRMFEEEFEDEFDMTVKQSINSDFEPEVAEAAIVAEQQQGKPPEQSIGW